MNTSDLMELEEPSRLKLALEAAIISAIIVFFTIYLVKPAVKQAVGS